MTPSTVFGAGITVLSILILVSVFHFLQSRKLPRGVRPVDPRGFIKRFFVTGTDTDLKLELLFLSYLLLLCLFSPRIPRPTSDKWLLLVLAFLLGFHLRQWLSKWRLRNLVFFPILLEDRFLYFKGLSDNAIVLVNLGLGAYLASESIGLAAAQFVGFIAHEVSLETRKGRRLLTRKLYLFDLEGLSVPRRTYEQLLKAVGRYDFRRLDQIATEAESPKDKLLLTAFAALLRDDFGAFRKLLVAHREEIRRDPDLLYYFGKALYVLGDVEQAREYLQKGCDEHNSRLCVSYFALSLLADATERREIERVLGLFGNHSIAEPKTKGEMFLSAYHALSLAISTSRYRQDSAGRLAQALTLIHQAFAINDRILREGDLGPLGRAYYRSNDQIFQDIYGYVLLRMGNLSLAFRALHAAIADDDTYPWPYFHLALIYQDLGRSELAESLLLRIARHERSDSVLKKLCLTRLESLKERRDSENESR